MSKLMVSPLPPGLESSTEAGEAGRQRGWHSKGPGRERAKVERARTSLLAQKSPGQEVICKSMSVAQGVGL